MSLYVFHNVLKSVQRLCGLGIETDIFAEIQFPCLFLLFDDDGLSRSLAYQSQYFGVSIFAIDDNLFVSAVFLDILLLYLLLQAEYDRAGCVNDFYIVAAGNVISFTFQENGYNLDLGMYIIFGILISIPLFIFSVFLFRYFGKKYPDLVVP